MTSAVRVTKNDAVVTIAINRPERRNALNQAVANGIIDALNSAEEDRSVRAVILTGVEDKAFCAGGDLQLDADGTPFTIAADDPRHYVAALFRRMRECRLPLVARVNGHALAGGFGLMCACDLAVVVDEARLGVTEVNVGLFPMMILPHLLRVLPDRLLMEMCLTGQPISAHDAKINGVVNYVSTRSELDKVTDKLVSKIVSKSPTGIRLGKQSLVRIREMNFDGALEYGQFMLANMAKTADAREGFAAFAEKRTPVWTGE